jgi:hypothetical protein
MVVRIRFDIREMGTPHAIRVAASRPDGTDLGIQRNIGFGTPKHAGPLIGPERGIIINLLVNILHLRFDSPGVYSFDFFVDDTSIGNLQVPTINQVDVREL